MEYNIEFVKKILKDQERSESRFKGICQIIEENTESIMTEKTIETIKFIKSRFPKDNYAIVFNEYAVATGFKSQECGGYCFASQKERVFFLKYLINELEYKPMFDKPGMLKLSIINNFKNFLKKIFKWQ